MPATTRTSVLCLVILFAFAFASFGGPILSVDFNDRLHNAPEDTQEGFKPFVIDSEGYSEGSVTNVTTRKFGKFTVSLEDTLHIGYDDRTRTQPTDRGEFTQSALLRDFVFASGSVTGTAGLQVTIQGLSPNEEYDVSVWSFDAMSKGKRVSRWTANGLLINSAYSFSGDSLPLRDSQYRIDFKATADSSGGLIIRGEREPDSVSEWKKPDYGVFLNAFQISETRRQNEASGATK